MTAVVAADLIGRAEEYVLIDTNILTEFTIAALIKCITLKCFTNELLCFLKYAKTR